MYSPGMYKSIFSAVIVSLLLCSQVRSSEGVQVLHPFPYDFPSQMMRGADGNFYGYIDYDESDAIAAALGLGQPAVERVFQLTPLGLYHVVHFFAPNYGPVGTPGPDGGPAGPIVAAPDGSLYGAFAYGGANGYGALYRLTPDGTYTHVFEATAEQSIEPFAITPEGDIYGLNVDPTLLAPGYICKLSASGEFTILYTFPASTASQVNNVFSDAASAALPRSVFSIFLASDGTIYGTTRLGGYVWHDNGVYTSSGTLFSLTAGGVFTVLQNGQFSNWNGEYHVMDEASDGTLFGSGSPVTTELSGGGAPTEIYAYTPAAGYHRVRLFNEAMGDLDLWLLGADGASYAAVEFPFDSTYGVYGDYGGSNITMVDANGNATVLDSLPNRLADGQGDVTQTTIRWMLDGHDGYLYVIAAENTPITNARTTEGAPLGGAIANRAAAANTHYVTRNRFGRVRVPNVAQDRLAAVTDRVQLPKPRNAKPAAATINALRNDVITAGSRPAITSVSTPAHGMVEIVPATAKSRTMLRYTATDDALQDTFTYQVTDATGATATGQVVVYAAGHGVYRGTIASNTDFSRLGSAALTTGNLGKFSGNITFNKKVLHIASARFDANNSWRKTFYLHGNEIADVTLTRQSDGSIEGTVAGPTATGQFAAAK